MVAFWGLELKPGEPYVRESAHARLRITQAVLGSCDHFCWTALQCDTTDWGPVRLCVLNPALAPACHLELELQEDESVLLSVDGQSSIHLSGYYTYSHSGNHGCNSQKPTSKAVGSTCFNKKHQDICDKAPVIEEILNDQTVQQQGVNISTKDVKPSHNSGHGRTSEWGTHGNDTDDGNDKNGAMFCSSSGNKMEVDKPTGSKVNDYDGGLHLPDARVKRKASETDGEKLYTEKEKSKMPKIEDVLSDQSNDMDQVNEQTCSKIVESNAIDDVKPTRGHQDTMEVLENPTGSKVKCYDGVLPLLDASVKRKAAEIDGERVHTEKGKLKMPKTQDVLSDQNNANQVNEQICSKIVESNAIDDAKLTLGHQNTLEDVLDRSQEPNVSQAERNDVADQITSQDTPIITSFYEGYNFTGAVENDVEQQDQEADVEQPDQVADAEQEDQEADVEQEDQEAEQDGLHHYPIQLLDNGMTMEHLVEGNTDTKAASKGKQVTVRYCGRLINGEVVDPTNLEDNTYTFRLGAGEVIRGWDIGILGMHVGGKRRLRIPPALGFGDVAKRNIPANSWLLYEVELLKVKRAKRAR